MTLTRPSSDQPLGIAPRAQASPGDRLGDAFTLKCAFLDHPTPFAFCGASMTHNQLPDPMSLAFAEAESAGGRGEVPIGCVIVDQSGNVMAKAGNRTLELKDPTAHAELLAIRRAAAELGSERLVGCDLYVTLEPCAMCTAAISFARIRRLYFAAGDEKMGGRGAWGAVLHPGYVPSSPGSLWRAWRKASAGFAAQILPPAPDRLKLEGDGAQTPG